jgi:hypothetical protein
MLYFDCVGKGPQKRSKIPGRSLICRSLNRCWIASFPVADPQIVEPSGRSRQEQVRGSLGNHGNGRCTAPEYLSSGAHQSHQQRVYATPKKSTAIKASLSGMPAQVLSSLSTNFSHDT